MKKIKVAFFAESLKENFDGAVRTMYQIIDRIPHREFDFLFITGEAPLNHGDMNVMEVPSLALPINHNYKVALSFLKHRKLHLALNEFKPDVVHIATPSPLGNFGIQYASKHQIPTISIYHTHFISYLQYYLSSLPALLKPAKKLVAQNHKKFYSACNKILIPTQQMMNELAEMGVNPSKFKLWKRGLVPGVFTRDKRNVSFMRKTTGNANPNILFASRLVREKNIKTLIDIYRKMQSSETPANLIIAGDGYAKAQMQSAMPGAHFFGDLNHAQLSVVYASADIFVFPSVSETYGNVVAEAMSSGLPCVIAKAGGSQEFIDHGKNGFLCSPNDAEDYVRHITQLIENPMLKQNFSRRSIMSTHGLCWSQLTNNYFDELRTLTYGNLLKSA